MKDNDHEEEEQEVQDLIPMLRGSKLNKGDLRERSPKRGTLAGLCFGLVFSYFQKLRNSRRLRSCLNARFLL